MVYLSLPIAFYCVIKPYLPQVIYRCTSEAWINVSDILTFCSGNVNTEYHNPASEGGGAAVGGDTPSSTSTGGLSGGCPNTTERSANDNSITFIISAEGTSWKHLYLVTSKIYPSGCVNQSNEKEFFDGKEMVAKKRLSCSFLGRLSGIRLKSTASMFFREAFLAKETPKQNCSRFSILYRGITPFGQG